MKPRWAVTEAKRSLAGPNHESRLANGRVKLQERQLKVTKPQLPKRRARKEIPAYTAMNDDARLADRMLYFLMRGVSTRNYAGVLPQTVETVGVSKSQVSR